MSRRKIFAAGVLVLAVLHAAAQTSIARTLDAPTIERIDAFVAKEIESSHLPGVAIAVLEDGRSPHVRGFGLDGRGKPITGDTPFPIGSLTKSFTALLVRQAIEAGQLDADAPIQRYLPWFRLADSEAASRITVRHLLNQTSGFSRADWPPRRLTARSASVSSTAISITCCSLRCCKPRPAARGASWSRSACYGRYR